MNATRYIAVRSDGSRVQSGDQIGYTAYPGHSAPTWFEFAVGTQNHPCDTGGSGGQIVIRYERYGRMVTPMRDGSDFGLTVYSVLDPRVADLLSADELQDDGPHHADQAVTGHRGGRLIGVARIRIPPHLLRRRD